MYSISAPTQKYAPEIEQTNVGGYGIKVEKVIFVKQFETYTEKICYTQNEEINDIVMYKNCTWVIADSTYTQPPQPQVVYPTHSPTQEYSPYIGQTSIVDYGINKDTKCYNVDKVIFVNQCEPHNCSDYY